MNADEIESNAIQVAAGVVFHQGRLLITQRRAGDHLGGLWEFPGGKLEQGESFESGLCRELMEELGIDVQPVELLETIRHRYPEKTVLLKFYKCTLRSGQPQVLGCQAFAWAERSELAHYTFPEADRQLLRLLHTRLDLWD